MATSRNPQSGQALYVSVLVVVVLTGMTTSMLDVVGSAKREATSTRDHLERLYIAEAGIRQSIMDLEQDGTGELGSAAAIVPFGDGGFWVSAVDAGDDTFVLTSRGSARGVTRTIEAVARKNGQMFHWAIYAGNSSLDNAYNLDFRGRGTQADEINGDIYSGGGILLEEEATLNGGAEAYGTLTGVSGPTGVERPNPDLQAMNYAANYGVDVAREFQLHGTPGANGGHGGTALELPESNMAHIFRQDPDDRTTEMASTQGPDFFLEDPYEQSRRDSNQDGTDPTILTLAPNGNRKVYYIEGNLWLHNRPTYSFQFQTQAGGTQVTFVVKGNIYFGDSLFYDDNASDGVAFIALKDHQRTDSTGNIYYGDPVGGTLRNMDSWMYAENDFVDNNLEAPGSTQVLLNGTMSAGNHVNINREGPLGHSRLQVDFDPRIRDGSLTMPGLPNSSASTSYEIISWREISPNS